MNTQHTWSDLEHRVHIHLSQLEDLEPVTAEPKGEKAMTSTCEYVRGDQSAYMCWIIEKARKFQKNIYFCFIDYTKAFDYVDHHKRWKIIKEMGIPHHLTGLLLNLYAGQEATARTGHGTKTGSKSGKEYIKAVYCYTAYLTYMQSTS